MTRRREFALLGAAGAWAAVLALVRPHPAVTLLGIALGAVALWRHAWAEGLRARRIALAVCVRGAVAIVRPHRDPAGFGRFYVDQTYHHQVLRALNHALVGGGDVSEVLEATRGVRAGDAWGWYRAWSALGDRSLARARSLRDRTSRGYALLRAHTYYLRATFFLPAAAPARRAASERDRAAFYEGLDALGVGYERFAVPYGAHHLNAVLYPARAAPRSTLLVFCGGSDTTVEELYFFLVPAALARGYSVLTFEGPGQGSVLRDQGLTMTPAWERPTGAVLDAYLAGHTRPDKVVMIGLSLGGYLAARAAAFEARIDGVVSYDVFFDGREVGRRVFPPPARLAIDAGLGRVVDALAPLAARFDPAIASGLVIGGTLLGQRTATGTADALARYRLDEVAPRIRQDVLAFAGDDDQFVPASQLARYRAALRNARSVTTHRYDRASGGAEHSQLGAATLWQADLFEWLLRRFP